MTTVTLQEAHLNLEQLISQVTQRHEPIFIAAKESNAVLISVEDWQAIQETLFLLSIPGMRESIKEGMTTPIEACAKELEW